MKKLITVFFIVLFALPAYGEDHDHQCTECEHKSFIPKDFPDEIELGDFATDWLAPWPHKHFSRLGTPYTHLYLMEPAFLDSDIFLNYNYTRSEGEEEQEAEIEFEYALTRRIGLIVELPYRHINPEPGRSREGLGDLALGTRLLLVDTEKFILSAVFESELPTGRRKDGFSEKEITLSPNLVFWRDLGNWLTFSGRIGSEHGTKTGTDTILFNGGLSYALLGPAFLEASGHKDDGHGHADSSFPPGLISLTLEAAGATPMSGRDRGKTTLEFLTGIAYALNDRFEIRGAVRFPLIEYTKEFNNGYLFSLVYHF
jgi:hypothetical protein